jgi:hypothetical protein
LVLAARFDCFAAYRDPVLLVGYSSGHLILRANAKRLRKRMLTNVLPGLRELRAPLAAGYLWLLFAWLVWGDELSQAKSAETADKARTPLDRFFELEPVISSIGLAVVASVAAYIVGSIVIDVQTGIGRSITAEFRERLGRQKDRRREQGPGEIRPGRRLDVTEAADRMLLKWVRRRAISRLLGGGPDYQH